MFSRRETNVWAGINLKDGVLIAGKRLLPTFLDNDEAVYESRVVFKRFPKDKRRS